jgi:hypothetical protein
MKMIRWDGRTVRLYPEKQPGKDTRNVTNEDLRAALQPTGSNPTPFAEKVTPIRDYFDVFFAGLERFAHFIRTELVDKDDLEPYLDQWITVLGDNTRMKPKILREYVHCSKYSGVEYLIDLWGIESTASIQCP